MITQQTSTTVNPPQVHNPWRYWLVGAPLALLALLANPNGPLGGFWAPSMVMQPSLLQLPFLIGLKVAEAVSFGFGIGFLLFGYQTVKNLKGDAPVSPVLLRAVHLSIAWLLFNWWPHDSLHIHIGDHSLAALIVVEYGFHVTLMIAGGILAYFFSKVLRAQG
ncbi:MAG: hypothetical protein U0350_43170 [Caldilineaceae bacterium]